MNYLRNTSIFLVIFLIFSPACGKDSQKKTTPGPHDKVYAVSLAPVEEKQVPETLTFKGEFIPLKVLEINSEFTGKVQTLSVEAGQEVLSGDLILKIDDENLPWLLDQKRAALREAEAQAQLDNPDATESASTMDDNIEYEIEAELDFLENQDTLPEEPSSPNPFLDESEMDAADTPGERDASSFANLARQRRQAQLAQLEALRRKQEKQDPLRSLRPSAPEPRGNNRNREELNQVKVDRIRAELELTEKQMENSTITSEIDGFVSEVQVVESDLVKAGDPLVKIITVDPIEMSFRIPKSQVNKMDKKFPVRVKVPDLGGQIFQGEISFIGADLDEDKKGVELRVRVHNPKQKIKIGMLGQAFLAVEGSKRKALLVPSQALVTFGGETFVYVQKGQVAHRVPVALGAGGFDSFLEINRGLRKGDRVVTQGSQDLKAPEEFIRTNSAK